ncbi:unnamed protein product [Heligmosomoides polygyrus]|uniref:DDE-1 domain-containing protein n=1 Tax=Heligmosomoides polygyrus TaxID=6339 RepID=A0A183F2N7_HELPZ|nr:unnamed protein product [Heligmosomoides polygyrus]
MTCRTDRYSGGTAVVFAPPVGAGHWLDTPYSLITARGVLPRYCRFRKPTAQVLSQVRESLQSEAVIGVGHKPSEIGEGVIPASWSAEVGGQPSEFRASELEDSHRVWVI